METIKVVTTVPGITESFTAGRCEWEITPAGDLIILLNGSSYKAYAAGRWVSVGHEKEEE